MEKHVVFMVHGVGEQVPGETVDEFVGAACEELELSGPVTNNTVMLANTEATRDDLLNLFPCHQRRLTGTNKDAELVLAEVHWADISPAPSGVIATTLDLLRLVLGMGYIALDNVQNNDVSEDARVQRLVPFFVWLFYAIIAPLNLFLLIGAFALLIDPFIFTFENAPIGSFVALGVFGLGFALVGHLRFKTAKTYMDSLIMRGLCACGLITMAFALVFATDMTLPLVAVLAQDCAELRDLTPICKLTYFTSFGVLVLKASWVLAVALLFLLVIISAPGARKNAWDKRSIYLAICSAMLILWMTITVAIWSLAIETITRVPSEAEVPAKLIIQEGFQDATQTLVYGVLALLVIVAVAIFVTLRRHKLRNLLSENDTQSEDIDKKYGRVILNPWLNIALFIGIAAFAFSTTIAAAQYWVTHSSAIPTGDSFWSRLYLWAVDQDAVVKTWKAVALFVISLIGFALLRLSDTIAAGVGVARDVTSYVTRSKRENPMLSDAESKYVYANEIQARFSKVVAHVMRQEGRENVSRITFMTHSQGTVVAAVGLKTLAKTLPVKPTLITMGSPVTHIYGHYFEKNYKFTEQTNGALERWLNIYRRDDFVGTRVHGNGTRAENFKIRPKGHSHYWSDKLVWKIFKERGVF